MTAHGTAARYKRGCRCEPCLVAGRKANRISSAAFRDRGRTRPDPAGEWEPVDGRLAVYCWCATKILQVKVEHLRAGRTYSCGQPTCKPLMRS